VVLFFDGRPFRIIGTDGGLLEAPREATQVLLTPGERLDVAAGPYEEGDTFFVGSLPYNRMTTVKPKQQRFARVQVTPARPSVANIPSELRKIDPLTPPGTPANRTVTFSVAPSLRRGLDFRVNDDLHTHDEPVHVGELQVWEIKNTSLMDHPFHLHGFFFQILEINGVPPTYRAWKDTINLPPRSTVKIAWIADNRPGNWMYHCHILEHHAAGMMAHFEVVEPNTSPQSDHHQTTHHH
jgi:FtsP/CotA-like multicopper oxidase with cupredoxin domain